MFVGWILGQIARFSAAEGILRQTEAMGENAGDISIWCSAWGYAALTTFECAVKRLFGTTLHSSCVSSPCACSRGA